MPNYMWFIIATAALIIGYIVYGSIVARVFGADSARVTPAKCMADGVDYVEMPTWKIWLVQLLNIAGVGPVFGPILGALWGPSALIWIVIGTIFAGAVHDYFSGMLSVRYNGANVPTIVGYNLGHIAKYTMRVFAVVLLLLVGVVFVAAPAGLLAGFMPEHWYIHSFLNDIVPASWLEGVKPAKINLVFWITIIFAYYFVATILPIDKIIGNLYPIFGAILMFMAIGVTVMLFVDDSGQFYNSIHSWTDNTHPKQAPIFPLVFITIACGALSGFHATQSPLMARCMANEKLGKSVFYGSMVAEGFIGLVWATVGMTFYNSPEALQTALAAGPAAVVKESCMVLMGTVGGVLAILGVVVLPITSGDTAFRAARLTMAEAINFPQKEISPRLIIAVPMFLIGIVLAMIDFTIIWRYFGWANQTLATIMLWAGAAYLLRRNRCHWVCTVPAVFMTAVCVSYICYEPKMGLGIPIEYSNIIAVIVSIAAFLAFMIGARKPIYGAPDISTT